MKKHYFYVRYVFEMLMYGIFGLVMTPFWIYSTVTGDDDCDFTNMCLFYGAIAVVVAVIYMVLK